MSIISLLCCKMICALLSHVLIHLKFPDVLIHLKFPDVCRVLVIYTYVNIHEKIGYNSARVKVRKRSCYFSITVRSHTPA